ncbi:MerR family transcriptional regulator [Agarivorans sp. B2Z047]|uniref:MerR family DNA-binding protein n=1 Tax=Agarivorans sp. B2Z047 TaxID=2652721 RepID=UPI00128B4236|nr:MerR family transcriptional regulator [Agarivorans sp. B2Z047]MPW27997.1 MerR family transcriptional regulator [Agarivorans sp. B2Z047]UQN44171.1 MerR family transcriptional regulator [Agarivorans sp. B2Z047]
MFKIGEVAKLSGLSVKTVRYYHDVGLVKAIKADNGYRYYRQEQVTHLRFLGNCRELGFSLLQSQQLLSLYVDKQRCASEVKAIATEHLTEIEQRIEQLQQLQQSLTSMVNCCRGDARPDCPIIDGLAAS